MNTITFNYQDNPSYDIYDSTIHDLVQKARDVAENAYAPYSKFYVGAAIEMTDGTVVVGSNQENIAYPSGLCARLQKP